VNDRPRCNRCRKGLVWSLPAARPAVRGRRRVSWRLRAETRRKLAIRCLWCLAVFCPACARKHFEPRQLLVHRTAAAIDRLVASIVKTAGPKARCAVSARSSRTAGAHPSERKKGQ
jgi:hypothetical protein